MRRHSRIIIALLSLLMVVACSVSSFAMDKTLRFEMQDGKMVLHSIRSDEGNWFMDFKNMIPGASYHDKLNIENRSKKTYDLYMQAVPVDQSEIKESLLELISMDVKLDNKLIYSGTAFGKDYGGGNLRNVILLGRYSPGNDSVITVDLKLDESVGLEYNNILTQIDWKFMVTEVPDDTPPVNTGDSNSIMLYAAILAACAAGIILVAVIRKRRKDDK